MPDADPDAIKATMNLYDVMYGVTDPDMDLVQSGKQCMSCRFDINDGEDQGEPRVCHDCMDGEI